MNSGPALLLVLVLEEDSADVAELRSTFRAPCLCATLLYVPHHHPTHCTTRTCGGKKSSSPDQYGVRCSRSLQSISGLSNLSGLMSARLWFIALMLQFLMIIFGPTCSSNIFPLTLPSVETERLQPASPSICQEPSQN